VVVTHGCGPHAHALEGGRRLLGDSAGEGVLTCGWDLKGKIWLEELNGLFVDIILIIVGEFQEGVKEVSVCEGTLSVLFERVSDEGNVLLHDVHVLGDYCNQCLLKEDVHSVEDDSCGVDGVTYTLQLGDILRFD